LKGTYFAAAKLGPGVLLFHQSNRLARNGKKQEKNGGPVISTPRLSFWFPNPTSPAM
jgi:hypothetical protein